MITINGSMGEGGGQVLRTSLSLSALTGEKLHIQSIRARRAQPGLKAQHLSAVNALTRICRAEVEGAVLGSQEITFHPAEIRSGRYRFEIKTAGSATLVFQSVYLPLAFTSSASHIIIQGGTHVPWSPNYHYLAHHWLRFIQRSGIIIKPRLDRAGFYPRGGGQISFSIRPVRALSSLSLERRGPLSRIRGFSGVANLDISIAERQKRRALKLLAPHCSSIQIRTQQISAPSKGSYLILLAEYESQENDYVLQAAFTSIGERGKPAEVVAQEAVTALLKHNDSSAAIDPHLADQLLLPLAFATAPSSFTTSSVSSHLLTNASVIEAFSVARINITGQEGNPGRVTIEPRGGWLSGT